MGDTIKINTNTWSMAANPVQTGSSGSDDLTSQVTTTIDSLMGALNTIGFMENIQNFKTALEDFGYGLNAALACVSIDLQVVASGLGAAAAAFEATDASLVKMFANLESQLGYYTQTTLAPGVTPLTLPATSAQTALNSLTVPSSTSSGSFWDSTAGHIVIGAGFVVAFVAVAAFVIVTLPVDALVAAGAAVVTAGAAFFSWAVSL